MTRHRNLTHPPHQPPAAVGDARRRDGLFGRPVAGRRLAIPAIALLLMTASLTACGKSPADEGVTVAAVEPVSAHRTVQIDWEKSWDDAFSRARKEDKPVLVTFEAEWCVWCKKLESTTYRDSAVMALIADSVVPLTLDVDGSGRELSDEHRVDGLPTVLVLSPTGEERGRIDGYLPPGRFVEVMTRILHES